MINNDKKITFALRCSSRIAERFKKACKYERRTIGGQFEYLVEKWLKDLERKGFKID